MATQLEQFLKRAEAVLARGNAAATIYTCDLSHEYVTINADYRS